MKVLREIQAYCTRHGLDGRINSVDDLDWGIESDGAGWRDGCTRANPGHSLHDEVSGWIQEGNDSGEGLAWIELADLRLRVLVEELQRARHLATRLQGVLDEDQRTAARQEISVLAESLREATTTSIGGGPGSRSGAAWVYCSGSGRVVRRTTAKEPVGDDLPDCPDPVRLLEGLIDAPEAVGAFERCIDEVGRSFAGLSDARRRLMVSLSRSVIEQSKIQSRLPGFDHAYASAVIGELQTQTVVYQVTLEVLSRVLQPSLVDFLR
ncbi:MAG: hypothetical protein P1T08_07740 [Acidimicrobiia bacterium]|nr:hypothetical protein [Acidimicrobiia bacterium]